MGEFAGELRVSNGSRHPEVFWGEMTPADHSVQIYTSDGILLDALEEFVTGGLLGDESVIVISTKAHREALEDRLRANGVDIGTAQSEDRYIPLDAEKTLSKFMVNGWPDEILFEKFVKGLVARAGKDGRRVRAFGEMVAILWAQGLNGATVKLEHLWNAFCQKQAFCLFCAYPRIGFTQDANESIREICAAHSKVIAGSRAA
jgi:hypothetical protein